MKKNILFLFVLSSFMFSCSNDDEATGPVVDDDTPSVAEARAETIQTLSNGDTKTWYIVNAELVNENGTFNVTNNFNITDDDFIFKQNGEVQWNQSFDINQNATSAPDVVIDYYLEPISGPLVFNEESSDEFTLYDGVVSLSVEDENTITGSINFEGRSAAAQLNITLGERTPQSYPSPPSAGLNFNSMTSYISTGIFGEGAGGFIGSYSDNSLFLAFRDPGQNNAEVVLKYNLDNNTWTENVYVQSDFVTKRLHIINNELVVFGAKYANTYPLQPNGVPSQTFQHNLELTRFGLAVQGDLAFVTGNGSQNWGQPAQIRSFNYLTNAISHIATLPKARLHAGTEIINNKLYIFGGRPDFAAAQYDAESYIVDLVNGNISSFMMNDAPTESYAAKFQNLIYVGYNYLDGSVKKIKFGVYNTSSGNYTDISDNLADGNDFEIAGMTVFNDFLYVIYKPLVGGDFSIQRASIN